LLVGGGPFSSSARRKVIVITSMAEPYIIHC
jgi:hypothetical protein